MGDDAASGQSKPEPFKNSREAFKQLWTSAIGVADSQSSEEATPSVSTSAPPPSASSGSTSSSSSLGAWAQLQKARKAVAKTARAAVAYDDTVPLKESSGAPAQMLGNPQDAAIETRSKSRKDPVESENNLLDLEGGEAQSHKDFIAQSASWAKKGWKGAKKNMAAAAEKTQLVEWDSQGLKDQMANSLSNVKDGAGKATSKISETGKNAQKQAKVLHSKSSDKLTEAKEASASKAREAKEKASAAAGAAKGKAGKVAGAAKSQLNQAGQNFSGLAALTLSPATLAKFAGVFFVGIFLISTSISFLPMLPIAPQKFSLLFAFGSMTLLSSFAILKGPSNFASSLIEKQRLPFSATYAVGLVGTLIATILLKSYILTAFFGGLQAFALLYFVASYVPGGQACLAMCGNCCSKGFGRCMGK